MFLLYEFLLYVAFIIALPWFLVVGAMRGKYLGSFRARLGRYDEPSATHELWLHAVSVGEVAAAKVVLDRFLELRPGARVVVTTTTATGQTAARRIFSGLSVTYFPFDFSFAVRRFLRHHRPSVFASIETEIWPNTVRLTSAQGVALVLLNGRLSDKSYPRYRAFRWLLRPILARYDAILAREEEDRERFIAIGARPQTVEVCGNVKFDYQVDPTPLEVEPALRQWIGARKLFVAGSTREGEDEMLIPMLPRLISAGCVVLVAPRKPERFDEVAGLLSSAGLSFFRRSRMISSPSRGDVLLLDSVGELARMYRLATVAFLGGSLVPTGGHNPIEPAAVGTPVAFGPHMTNFRDVASTFLEDGSARQVQNVEDLAEFVLEVAGSAERHGELSRKVMRTVERNRGAALRNAQRIVELLN